MRGESVIIYALEESVGGGKTSEIFSRDHSCNLANVLLVCAVRNVRHIAAVGGVAMTEVEAPAAPDVYARRSILGVLPIVAAGGLHVRAITEATGVDEVDGVVEDIGVAVPGLGVGGVDGGEAGGVGGSPTALHGVFAEKEIVASGHGVRVLTGERNIGRAGLGIGLAERRISDAGG